MKQKRASASCVLIGDGDGDRLFVCGGGDGHRYLNSSEMYDFSTSSWNQLQPMTHSASNAGICYWNEKKSVVVVGGYDGYPNPSPKASIFDLHSNKWRSLPDTSSHHPNRPSVSIFNPISLLSSPSSLIVVAGNYSSNCNLPSHPWSSIECLDIRDSSQKWMVIGDIKEMMRMWKRRL